jgi:hypothetical protein
VLAAKSEDEIQMAANHLNKIARIYSIKILKTKKRSNGNVWK